MSERLNNERPAPLEETSLDRAKRDPELLARLRRSLEAKRRGERPIPATELTSESRTTDAGD
jgi:hypothetical protein